MSKEQVPCFCHFAGMPSVHLHPSINGALQFLRLQSYDAGRGAHSWRASTSASSAFRATTYCSLMPFDAAAVASSAKTYHTGMRCPHQSCRDTHQSCAHGHRGTIGESCAMRLCNLLLPRNVSLMKR